MTAAEASAKLAIVSEGIWSASKKALDEWMAETLLISKENFCPVDKGDLKASAKIEKETDTAQEYALEASYNTTYAIYVHEILTNHHDHGQAKFLEVPFNLQQSKLEEELKIAVMGVT
jgi:hypothetical protein